MVKYMIKHIPHISNQLALKRYSFIHAHQGMSIFDNVGLNIMTSVIVFRPNDGCVVIDKIYAIVS
jgi:hypothetical protein